MAGFVEGVGEDREDYATVVAADEIETAFLLDELNRRRHAFGSIHRIGKRIKRKLDASERKIDLYQIGTDAAQR